MKKLLLSLACVLATGCAHEAKFLGRVGDTSFYAVRSSAFDGPNVVGLVSEKDGKAHVESTFSGAGIGTSIGSQLITTGTSLGSAVLAAEAPTLNSTVKVAK